MAEPFAGNADCAQHVLQKLSPRSIVACSAVCRLWRSYVQDESLWQHVRVLIFVGLLDEVALCSWSLRNPCFVRACNFLNQS